MLTFLRSLIFIFLVKPFVLVVLGLNVRGLNHLPRNGPAIVVANHNSHLDTLVLFSLFPLRMIGKIRPVGAKDYFMCNPLCRWISRNILRLIPLERHPERPHDHPLTPCVDALKQGEILILFPEGSRGDPEKMGGLKNGVAHLVKMMPEVPVVPVFIQGTGKALPRGETLLVPLICRLAFGAPLAWAGNRETFMQDLNHRFTDLEHSLHPQKEKNHEK